MNEKFNPQSYRDNLAKDLKKLRSEGEKGRELAKNTLEGSNMPWYHSKAHLRHEDLRYKTTKDIHKNLDLERFKDLPSDPDKFKIIINNIMESLYQKTRYRRVDTIDHEMRKIFIKNDYAAMPIRKSGVKKSETGRYEDDRYFYYKGVLVVDSNLNFGLSDFDLNEVKQKYVEQYNPFAFSYDPEFDEVIINTLEKYPSFSSITDINHASEGEIEVTVSFAKGGSKVFNVVLNQKLTEKEIEENINRKIHEMNKKIEDDQEDKQWFGA